MIIDLLDYIDIVENDKIIDKILKSEFSKNEKEFINNFLEITFNFKWTWFNEEINEQTIITNIIKKIKTIIKQELFHFKKYGKWELGEHSIKFIDSGRIIVLVTDLNTNEPEKHIWLEINLLTSL